MTKPPWPIWCHIVCRTCATTVAGQFNFTTLNKPTMRNEALKNGWRLIADDWLCVSCIASEKEKLNDLSR